MTQSPPRTLNTSDDSGEVSSGVDQASDTVSAVMDQAQNTARQVGSQAKQSATSRLESQKERAVDSLVTIAQALRQTGQHLREQDQGTVGTYIEKAAERVDDLTNHLRANDVTQLVAETQTFARRRPAMFLGAALALGFAGARFLMSSGQRASARDADVGAPARWEAGRPYVQEPAAAFETPGSTYDSPDATRPPNTSGIAGPTGSSAS